MHLRNGDPQPTLNREKLTLFGYRFCPFTDRIKLLLGFYEIDYDLVNIFLPDKPEWFASVSPDKKVPLLLYLGDKLSGSDLILSYIDENYGGNGSLLSICGEDAFREALQLSSKFFSPAHKIIYKESYDDADVTAFNEACVLVNSAIKEGPFFAGDKISLADFALFSLLNRFEVALARIQNLKPDLVEEVSDFNKTTFETDDEHNQLLKSIPCLIDYLKTMRKQKFAQSVQIPLKIQAKFAETERENHPNPDIDS